MSSPEYPNISSNWTFYVIGLVLVLLGVAFFLIPSLFRSGVATNMKLPWYIIYVYNKGDFYFAISPLLFLVAAITLVFFYLRR